LANLRGSCHIKYKKVPLINEERKGLPEKYSNFINPLKKQKNLFISGIPDLTCQSNFLTINPSFSKRIIFWLLKSDEIPQAKYLLDYWHKINKSKKAIWSLDTINPLRASDLKKLKPQIILVDFNSLENKLPSLNNNQNHQFTLAAQQQLSQAKLVQKLITFGYEYSNQASQAGYFAKRGGIIDVYPINSEEPIRLEFQDNIILSINTFNPVNKKIDHKIENLNIIAQKFTGANSRTTIFGYFEATIEPLIMYHENEEIKSMLPHWQTIEKKLANYQNLIIQDFNKKAVNLSFEHAPFYYKKFNELTADLKKYHQKKWQITIATNKAKELKQLFKEKKVDNIPITFWPYISDLTGFQNTKAKFLFLTDKEVFGEQNIKRESPHRRVDQAFIMELKPGDYMVHLDHGIGRFNGMTKNVIEGITKEYFSIQYAEGDKLSVPVETADKISKYIGIAHPKLHRLSGGHWYQLTRKVKQEAKVLAQELLKIYANREMTKIKPFFKNTPEDNELTKSFPYQETPDQAKAISDVKNDLEKETPMDRLICGDVGFGKTEVAVRAALKAVMNKKQVTLLSPTTILTQQHYDTFKERLRKFSIKMGILSRFETEKEQADTIVKLKGGLIDIVIGTHRLLSPDVNFKNLGLIIIDEEQRFGVKAKEKLKALRTHAHILTLTATPIPRTLNIALAGVRDISIIETPPEGRLPIKTNIEPFSDEIRKKSIIAELKRKGQVYYLHNKVETISLAAQELQKLIPNAKIGTAHGRLPERDLAKAMKDFDTQQTNLLVCSTIIENGLDLPNVNTLIVDNATNFGLAQLYQLRGRIGRGERQAYAYFLYHRKKLKGNAKKRLQALMEAKKLGSGFQLALRDLEIRGAGNILGKEQHGKVSAIGLSLYTRLLAQAIEELKFGKVQEPVRDIIIDLPLESYIPQNFLPEEERLMLYQKMAGIFNYDELQELKDKMIRSRTKEEQRTFPSELLNLFELLEIKILAQKTDISHIDTSLIIDEFGHKKRKLLIKFLFPIKPENLARLIQKKPDWKFNDDSIKIDLEKLGKNWLEEIKKVIRIFQHKEKSAS